MREDKSLELQEKKRKMRQKRTENKRYREEKESFRANRGYRARRETKLGVRDLSLLAAMETTRTGDNSIPLRFPHFCGKDKPRCAANAKNILY